MRAPKHPFSANLSALVAVLLAACAAWVVPVPAQVSATARLADPQTWRILALRVEYPTENPDEPTTSGTGSFDLRPLSEALPDYALPYDTPPHDRLFYEHHLESLSRYFDVVSEGRVVIEYAVFPRELNRAYVMPRSALAYGNGRTPEEVGDRWVSLLHDAVDLGAADPDGPLFSEYDSYLIIHAGLGHETGQFNDVRSVYLSAADLASYGGGPIAVQGEAHHIRDAWILPEAVDDRGRAGLNGMLAKFFGHQLGLPGLSNFTDGVPGVGGWSLMDVGANRLGFLLVDGELQPVFGFAPPHPMAWSKVRLGWVEPLTVRRDTAVAILASDRSPLEYGLHPKVVKIPISDSEYFLIENRQQRGQTELPSGVEAPFGNTEATWVEPKVVEFSAAVEDGATESTPVGTGAGVWLAVEEYDAFVPASGILIWHVDETIVAQTEAAGAINNDRAEPGIALEEADGSRDIGNRYFDRQHLIEGHSGDAYFVGTGPAGEANTRFGPQTRPGTRSNTGVDTGVDIEVLSEPEDTMRVRISFRRALAQWPRHVDGGRRLQTMDIEGDGISELVIEDESGVSLVRVIPAAQHRASMPVGPSGARLLAGGFPVRAGEGGSGPGVAYVAEGPNIEAWDLAAVGEPDALPLWSTPISATARAGLLLEGRSSLADAPVLVAGSSEGLVWLDALTGDILGGGPSLGDNGLPGIEAMAAADLDGDGIREVLAGSGTSLSLVRSTGVTTLWEDEVGLLPPAAGDLNGDGRSEVVVVSMAGRVQALDSSGEQLWTAETGEEPVGSPVLGDVDGDGSLEVVIGAMGSVHGLRSDGLCLAGFPAAPVVHQSLGTPVTAPILVDLDGDSRREILLAMTGGIAGYSEDGRPAAGFPMLIEGSVAHAPAAADLTGDGNAELALLTSDLMYVWDLGSLDEGYGGASAAWPQGGFSAAGTNAFPGQPSVPGPGPDGGLMPSSRVYCYPNPVAADSEAHLRFFLARPARLDLQVHNAIGERVDRIRQDQTEAGEGEIAFPARDYASGLYLCRLKARGLDGTSASAIVRMAVVR